jgi:hypothetical protein
MLPFSAESARCFTSNRCRIAELNGRWVLESSSFNSCSHPADVFPLADAIVSTVRRIASLYQGLSHPFIVSAIQCIDDNGQIGITSIRGTLALKITSPSAITELLSPIQGHPLATAIFQASLRDDRIKEALTLYQDIEDRWADVYNIIEFLGGPDRIARSGLGDRKLARHVKQAANYYRHLGRPKPYPLPLNPPTLPESASFAKRALREWIQSRL